MGGGERDVVYKRLRARIAEGVSVGSDGWICAVIHAVNGQTLAYHQFILLIAESFIFLAVRTIMSLYIIIRFISYKMHSCISSRILTGYTSCLNCINCSNHLGLSVEWKGLDQVSFFSTSLQIYLLTISSYPSQQIADYILKSEK